MKKIALIFTFVFISLSGLYAQDGGMETIFSGKLQISGFGAPLHSWGNVNGKFALFRGGGGGVTFNRRLFIGGYNLSTRNRVRVEHDTGGDSHLEVEHSGFWVGYDFMPKTLIHPTVSLKTGWGSASLSADSQTDFEYANESIFVVEPEVGAEINVAKFFKLALSGSYRMVQNQDSLVDFDVENLSGFALNASLKFGWFN